MKPNPPALSPLLRSDAQGLILALLFMNPTDGYSISDLARFAKVSVPTAMREVDRLLDARLVTQKSFGRARLIQVNTKHLLHDAVKQIVSYSYGPVAVLPAALYAVDGLEAAYIYGPYAAHLKHELGPDLHEVDLLLVGYMNRIEATKAAERVEGYLGRAVNVQFVSGSDWENDASDFVRDIKSRPLIELTLDS